MTEFVELRQEENTDNKTEIKNLVYEFEVQELKPKKIILLSLFIMEKSEINLSFISRQDFLEAAQRAAPEIIQGKNLYSHIKPLIDATLIKERLAKEEALNKRGYRKYSLTKKGLNAISDYAPLIKFSEKLPELNSGKNL